MKKKILYIDDIKTNLFTMQTVIEDLASDKYEIFTALSASDGLSILLKQSIDIVLLDVMMPEIDGFECARMLKSNKKTKNLPIIFVTANKDDKTIETCYKVGGDDYVNKPFNHTELLARISFHLKSKEQDKLLVKEKEYAQSILNLQENMIVITDGTNETTVNKALLNFFGAAKIEAFTKQYTSIHATFIQEDGYFDMSLVQKATNWVEELIARSKEEDVLVKIIKDDDEYIFNVKATTYFEHYIVTLTDITQVSKLSIEYKREASYDNLTQVYNRNMFQRLIDLKLTKALEDDMNLLFIILDIDFFKKVNDTHGHLVGDDVLVKISKLIGSNTRSSDVFARWGGEEFVLALEVQIQKGMEIANNLRMLIEKETFEVVGQITCSFGVTQYKQGDTLDAMILRADEALYKAKENGRNQVCEG